MSELYDVAIIGGGLAGCAAAIRVLQAAPQTRVLVLECGRYPRQKVCGEFLSSEGVSAMRQLAAGSDALKQLLASATPISRARLHALERSADFPVEPAALSASRFDLDRALWQHAIAIGADCFQKCALSRIEGSRPFRITTRSGEFHARAVINAAGRWSAISAPQPDIQRDRHRWIGLKAHYRECAPSNAVELYFFPHGYCGVQPVGENTINACAMVRADAATRLEEVFALNPTLQARSRSWQVLTEPVATAPLIFRNPQPVARAMFNVGDAAGFIDPFSGNGMTLALQSGILAAECLAEHLSAKADLDAALALYAVRYREQLQGSFRRVGWVRMLLSMPRPAAIAILKLLDLPGMGNLLVRKTRSAALYSAADSRG